MPITNHMVLAGNLTQVGNGAKTVEPWLWRSPSFRASPQPWFDRLRSIANLSQIASQDHVIRDRHRLQNGPAPFPRKGRARLVCRNHSRIQPGSARAADCRAEPSELEN